jgi:hypothetical protein
MNRTPAAPAERTITLTDRPPVMIREVDWPVIAIAKHWQGEFERQSPRTARIYVREHQDGRRLVYGVTTTQYISEPAPRAGVIVAAPGDLTAEELARGDELSLGDNAATVEAIKQVARLIGYPDLAQACIADLPAEVL